MRVNPVKKLFLLMIVLMLAATALADPPEWDVDAEGDPPEWDAYREPGDPAEGADERFESLLQASVGDFVKAGIWHDCGDYWYKLGEDEDAVYLMYGDYYRTELLYFGFTVEMVRETGMTTRDPFGLLPVDNDADKLLDYLQDENMWPSLSEAFERAFPLRVIRIQGGPTVEQLEAAMRSGMSTTDMLRPYTDEVCGCLGYWLASGKAAGENAGWHTGVYEYNCVYGGIEDNLLSNGDAVRPVVAISKQKREKTEQELLDESMRAAEEAANASEDVIHAGGHTLEYGRYVYDDGNGYYEIYLIRPDGTFEYDSPDFAGSGEFLIEAWDDGIGEWDGTMQLVAYFDGEFGGGRDWLDIPDDNTLSGWDGRLYAYAPDE